VVSSNIELVDFFRAITHNTRWFKYDRDYLCVNKSQFVPAYLNHLVTFNVHRPIPGSLMPRYTFLGLFHSQEIL
jgi:hypothetical protein